MATTTLAPDALDTATVPPLPPSTARPVRRYRTTFASVPVRRWPWLLAGALLLALAWRPLDLDGARRASHASQLLRALGR